MANTESRIAEMLHDLAVMAEKEEDIENIRKVIDELDEILPDRELVEHCNQILSPHDIHRCFFCNVYEERNSMKRIQDGHNGEDFSELVCWNCC